MIEKICDLLCVPRNSRLKSRIAFNQIFKAFSLTTKEQKEISNNVDKIYLIGEVNSRNCNYQTVNNDEYVYVGQPIGLGGNTGRSTGSHLHLETRFCGIPIDPLKIFNFKYQDAIGDNFMFLNKKQNIRI